MTQNSALQESISYLQSMLMWRQETTSKLPAEMANHIYRLIAHAETAEKKLKTLNEVDLLRAKTITELYGRIAELERDLRHKIQEYECLDNAYDELQSKYNSDLRIVKEGE